MCSRGLSTDLSANREILRLAVPNILTNATVPLLSTVDTVLMGHLTTAHLGAVGLASMLFNMIYWNFGFLRMGTTGMTAQAFGAGSEHIIKQLLVRSSLLAVGIAIVLIVFQRFLISAGQWFFAMPAEQMILVHQYFSIRIWAAPATLLLYVVTGWFFGLQNALFPLLITLVGHAINIVLSVYFVRHLNWGIGGAAWGTFCAEIAAIALSVALIGYRYLDLLRSNPTSSKATAAQPSFRFGQVQQDLFIRTACLTFVFAFFYRESMRQGSTYLAAQVVLLQLIYWHSYAIDGFAYAAESIVGKYKGRRQRRAMNAILRHLSSWCLGIALIFSLSYWLAGQGMIGLFTNQPTVVMLAVEMLPWVVVFPIVSFLSYLWDGVFIGLTATKALRNSMIMALGIFLGTYAVLTLVSVTYSIWISMIVFVMTRGLIQTGLFYRYRWELR